MGNFGGGNFWQTIHVKAIGEENLVNTVWLQSFVV